MDDRTLLETLAFQVIKGKVKEGTAVTEQAIAKGINPHLVINEGLVPGMDVVGELFRTNQYFIPEVLLSARTMNGSMALLRPLIVGTITATVGVAVVGTVKGDIHDIGKNLVCMLLEAAQFKVHNLGVNNTPEKILEAAEQHGADIVGLSALLSVTMPNIGKTVEHFEKMGVRQKYKIICGGAPVTAKFAQECGTDAYGANAPEAVRICRQWVEDKKVATA
ncbi:MAG: cobalamin-dependent protein [Candidatus Rokuibacteriota bacterium]